MGVCQSDTNRLIVSTSMSRKGDDAIRSFLHSSETLSIALDVELTEGTNFGVAPAHKPNVKPNDTEALQDTGWLLSIVTHALGESEQARWVTSYSFGEPGTGPVTWVSLSRLERPSVRLHSLF